MTARSLWVAVVFAIVAAAGCRSSPPKRFYVLEPVQTRHPLASKPNAPVQIATVNIPPALDRQEMVREQAPHSLEISDVNRWGAPLADMMQNVLTRDLIDRLPPQQVVLPRTSAAPGTFEITIDILQFEANASAAVVLEGGWSLYRLGSDIPVMSHNVTLSEPVASAGYDGQARAMSELLGLLADNIAQSLPSAVDADKR